jgi:hypothetical protein
MGDADFRQLKQLEEENPKHKRLVTDLSLDKAVLHDVLRKELLGLHVSVSWWSTCTRRTT